MTPKRHQDPAFTHLLHNVLNPIHATDALAKELVNEQANDRAEQLLALQRRLAMQPPRGFEPGHIVRWKSGLKNRQLPAYGEHAIVMEVLDPPVFDPSPQLRGSNLFREPLSLAVGMHDAEGDFLVFHLDGRRFEVVENAGPNP